jgi:hypothetical protein
MGTLMVEKISREVLFIDDIQHVIIEGEPHRLFLLPRKSKGRRNGVAI